MQIAKTKANSVLYFFPSFLLVNTSIMVLKELPFVEFSDPNIMRKRAKKVVCILSYIVALSDFQHSYISGSLFLFEDYMFHITHKPAHADIADIS